MIVVRVYLKSGQHFDVCAENVKCEYSGLTGELTSFSYTGAVSGIPVYLDVGKVEAVVQLKAQGGGVNEYEDSDCEPEEVLPKDKADEIALKLMRLADLESLCSYDRLRELAEADRDGRLVVLPVKPVLTPILSNMLYIIEDGEIYEDALYEAVVGMSESGKTNVVYTTLSDQMTFEQADIGKTVFLTREEAGKALEAMRKGEVT